MISDASAADSCYQNVLSSILKVNFYIKKFSTLTIVESGMTQHINSTYSGQGHAIMKIPRIKFLIIVGPFGVAILYIRAAVKNNEYRIVIMELTMPNHC